MAIYYDRPNSYSRSPRCGKRGAGWSELSMPPHHLRDPKSISPSYRFGESGAKGGLKLIIFPFAFPTPKLSPPRPASGKGGRGVRGRCWNCFDDTNATRTYEYIADGTVSRTSDAPHPQPFSPGSTGGEGSKILVIFTLQGSLNGLYLPTYSFSQPRMPNYSANALSIASTNALSSGSTLLANLAITSPFRFTRNFSKFHLISLAFMGL